MIQDSQKYVKKVKIVNNPRNMTYLILVTQKIKFPAYKSTKWKTSNRNKKKTSIEFIDLNIFFIMELEQ